MPEASTALKADASKHRDLAGGPKWRSPARSDGAYWFVLYGMALIFIAICAAFLVTTVLNSLPAWRHSGFGLIFGTTWDPDNAQYGALPLIFGTLETSFIALLFAVPLGLLVAVAIVHLIPNRFRSPISSFVELLAAIPSVVYGFIGILVLAPWFQQYLLPWLKSTTHNFPLFSGAAFSGYSILLAGVVLFVMVLPTIVALSRDAIASVAHDQVEGAMSIGATRWQTIFHVVLPAARTGIIGAVTLAAARALGETIAVAMVVGGAFKIHSSISQGGNTMAAAIATGWDGATALTISALFALGVILIAITAAVNTAGRRMLSRANRGAQL